MVHRMNTVTTPQGPKFWFWIEDRPEAHTILNRLDTWLPEKTLTRLVDEDLLGIGSSNRPALFAAGVIMSLLPDMLSFEARTVTGDYREVAENPTVASLVEAWKAKPSRKTFEQLMVGVRLAA